MVPWTWWPHDEVGHTDEAKKEIITVLGDADSFDTPKPTRLIKGFFKLQPIQMTLFSTLSPVPVLPPTPCST